MKRFLFGAILCFLGTAIWGFSFAYIIITSGVLNSTVFYSDIVLIGSLRVYNLLIPFIISFIILSAGLVICGYEAYFNK